MEQRHQARMTGSLLKFRESLIRPQLLIFDDFGMKKWTPEEAEDFRELLEERSCGKSILITTQLPYDHWPEVIGEPRSSHEETSRLKDERAASLVTLARETAWRDGKLQQMDQEVVSLREILKVRTTSETEAGQNRESSARRPKT